MGIFEAFQVNDFVVKALFSELFNELSKRFFLKVLNFFVQVCEQIILKFIVLLNIE